MKCPQDAAPALETPEARAFLPEGYTMTMRADMDAIADSGIWDPVERSVVRTLLGGAALAGYGYGRARYGPGPPAANQAFVTLIVAQLLYAFGCRAERGAPAPRRG